MPRRGMVDGKNGGSQGSDAGERMVVRMEGEGELGVHFSLGEGGKE